MADAFDDLEGDKTYASAIIGTAVDSQVTWTAQAAGRGGNQINITYIYLGPEIVGGIPMSRVPSSEVDGNSIRLYLGSDNTGAIPASVFIHSLFWLSNPDVTDLVSAVLVGTGADVPEASAATYLTGGKDRPVTLTEDASNQVAEVFGYKDHKDFLKAIDVPVIESAADAAAFLGEGDEYLIINGKLLIVSGTNLVGLNKLYEKTGNDLDKTKVIVDGMTTTLPTMVTTQNVTTTSVEFVCGATQTVSTVTETYRDLNTSINTSRSKWGGDLASFHHYIFWGEKISTTQSAYDRLVRWNIPEEYIGEILSGETATQEDYLEYQAPEVYKIDDLSLLTDLKFTDDELEELLQAGVDGVRIPHKVPMAERVQAQFDPDARGADLSAVGLTDGNYTATLSAAGVQDTSGNPMAGDHQFTFHVLTGDFDGDAVVGAFDTDSLYANFGGAGQIEPQATGGSRVYQGGEPNLRDLRLQCLRAR